MDGNEALQASLSREFKNYLFIVFSLWKLNLKTFIAIAIKFTIV